ncbi:TetR/AcrR family transcriptional regulator [Acetanaerobacterium elongatum]|uniref:Transcriptional regulator, TetR family n=1 Tax=Acetanaerobacterium elongatum TaxID=258515 RepID=A0A1H0DU05_9FIRM|nr:TetR/AcrR family transcriptional regulator [Acetanaerobacterium elongatum]SDN73481.1 transcriptional regulator, TetR family [Acetanaerobacterium elongatum]
MDNSKKQELLNACFAEFAQYGYDKANTNRICETAGVSKGLLFHYFGSKKNLYILCVEQCISDVLKLFDGFSTDGMSFGEAISAYGSRKLRFFEEHPLHYHLMIGAFMNTPDDVKAEFSVRYAELTAMSAEIITSLIQKLNLKPQVSKQAAMQLVSAVIGVLEQKYMPIILSRPMTDELYEQMKNEYLELMGFLLNGIAD